MPDERLRLSLLDLFERQDSVVAWNAEAAQATLPLLERALSVAFDITLHINGKSELRDAEPHRRITANLLHAAAGGVVSATRMALFGDHVSAFGILRLAFEDAYHAEFFRHRPDSAEKWDAAGQIADLDARRRYVDDFERDSGIRRTLDAMDGESRSRVFRDLSSFGIHSNAATTFMRLGLPSERGANLGFMSHGKGEATQAAVGYALNIAAYVVSEMHDSFVDLLTLDLIADSKDLRAEYIQLLTQLPSDLSLI